MGEVERITPEKGKKYRWRYGESSKHDLLYLGKKGSWHQFSLVYNPNEIWCEVLDEDLHLLEEII